MKTAAYYLEDEQIAWIEKKADRQKTSSSAIVRGIVADAMDPVRLLNTAVSGQLIEEIKDLDCVTVGK